MKTVPFTRWVQDHPARAASLAGWYQQFLGIVGSLATVPFVIASLSVVDAGIWFAFQGFLTAITLTDFGFTVVISRQVAHSMANREGAPDSEKNDFIANLSGWTGVNQIYQAGRVLFTRVNMLALALLTLAHEAIIPFTKLDHAWSIDSTIAWYLLGASALVSLQVKLNQAMLEGIGRMYLTKAIGGTFQFITAMGIILVLKFRAGLAPISGWVLLSSTLQLIIIQWALHRSAEGRLKKVNRAAIDPIIQHLWRVALPIGVVYSSAYCVMFAQVPMVGAILGAPAVVPYYLAQRIIQVFTQTPSQVLQPQLPLFTRDYSSGNLPMARRRMGKTIAVVSILICGACLAYFVISPVFVRWWVGPNRYVTKDILFFMAMDYCLMCCGGVWGLFVMASGRNPFVRCTAINGILNLSLCAVLCYFLGLIGLPLAGLLSGVCTNYWFYPFKGWQLWRKLKQQEISRA